MVAPKEEFKPGVLAGDAVQSLFDYAKNRKFAMPAVNVIGTNSVNAVLETAAALHSPVIIQFSHGGGNSVCRKRVEQ